MTDGAAAASARRFLPLLLVLAFGACASERPVPDGPLVIPLPPAPSPAETALVEALEHVSSLLREGRLDEAGERLAAIRSGHVPKAYAPHVEALGDWHLALVVERGICAGSRVEVTRAELSAGEPIQARVLLVNPGPHAIRISTGSRDADEPRGVLTVSFREWGPQGARAHASYPIRFEPPEASLAAGERISRVVEIETPAEAPFSLLEVRIVATILPARLEADGRPLPVRRLEIPPTEVRVFPPGWEGIARAPLESLRRALLAGSPIYDRHVLTAAALVAPGEREEAMRACVEALDGPSPRRQASAMSALQYLSGRTDLPFEPTVWKRWWRTREEGSRG